MAAAAYFYNWNDYKSCKRYFNKEKMNKGLITQFIRPVIIVFILINTFCLLCSKWLDEKKIDHTVLIYGNLILFIITLIACYIYARSIATDNAHAFVRSVMMVSFIKLMAIAISVFTYLIAAGENRSVYAVAVTMLFYIIYTVLEVSGAMKINRQRNVKN